MLSSLKIGFPKPIEIRKTVPLHASPWRSFLYLVEHINRCGLRPREFDVLSKRATFEKRRGILGFIYYLTLAEAGHGTAVLTIGVKQPFWSRLFVEKSWYTDALQEFSYLVNDAVD